VVTFDVAGSIKHNANLSAHTPDGKPTWGDVYSNSWLKKQLKHTNQGTMPEGKGWGAPRYDPPTGMGSVVAPFGSAIVVFMDDNPPHTTPAPPTLRFDSAADLDYIEIKPELKQPIFVGDGVNSNGVRQRVVVPAGATRIFICNFDWYQYNDNHGSYVSAGLSIGNSPRLVR
ncbi:MAG: hypothetical protein AAF743_14275, partial [Planctomycetota bacterium]